MLVSKTDLQKIQMCVLYTNLYAHCVAVRSLLQHTACSGLQEVRKCSIQEAEQRIERKRK